MNLSELYKKIAKEFNVSPLMVENIIRHQFSFIKKNLQEKDLNTILVHGLGRFKVKEGRLDWMMKNIASKLEQGKISGPEARAQLDKLNNIKRERYGD